MDNLPHKISRKALFVNTICFLTLFPIIKAYSTFSFIDCPNPTLSTTSTYAPNSPYQTNLNTLLSVLSSNSNASNGFYNFTAGSSRPDVAYGFFLCRGDLSAAACQECVVSASRTVVERCPRSKRVTVWHDPYCMIRYSNESIFSSPDVGVRRILLNPQNVANVILFREVLGQVMDNIVARASSDDSGKKFATADANYSPLQHLYGLAQCTPDLSASDCSNCLRNGISTLSHCCHASQGARVLFPSCYVRYEMYPFYNASVGAAPPPPSPVFHPPPPPLATPSSPGNGRTSSQVIIAIAVPIGVVFMLFIAVFCFITRRATTKYSFLKDDNAGDDIPIVQSLQYDFGTIQAATNNFSGDNKIGEGGFGSVYKGLLPNGQEVAVKRLSRTSGQGALKFKNEVAWKLWRKGTPLDLMDPTLEGSYSKTEVTRCIHIALLCVQDDPDARPSMAKVVLKLNRYSATLSLPEQPRFLGQSKTGSNILKDLEFDQSTSKSIQWGRWLVVEEAVETVVEFGLYHLLYIEQYKKALERDLGHATPIGNIQRRPT
ncbi:hypothetical protein Vadar_017769 [Vaccinium darrowii]|uniref:Uncharacterized protein n=1 Tax=Vaccinium darrowii TaxID=229202 RepID=A0ACB7XAG5_9ERIC|nr:hypothetical protein Vadar_017769 [Vaccinium darrowii]